MYSRKFPFALQTIFFQSITLKQTIFFSQLQLANNFFTKKVTPIKNNGPSLTISQINNISAMIVYLLPDLIFFFCNLTTKRVLLLQNCTVVLSIRSFLPLPVHPLVWKSLMVPKFLSSSYVLVQAFLNLSFTKPFGTHTFYQRGGGGG